ncbi:right-handed parallel beta-helix repeat-containing protein [Hydrogenimonas sp.]
MNIGSLFRLQTNICALALFLVSAAGTLQAQSLQSVIDAAPAGAAIELPAGRFLGPITIDKPLILEGVGVATQIDGNGSGSVVTIRSPDVTIRNLSITGSGRQRYRLDSGVTVRNAERVTIERCSFDRTLFGITMTNTHHSLLRENNITSYEEAVVDNRGDGINLWGSSHNRIVGNRLIRSRDLSISRSSHTIVAQNRIEESRYGVLVQMSRDVNITGNTILSNYAGIVCKGGGNIFVTGNRIIKTKLATGIGVLLTHGRNIRIERNTIMRHSQAIYIDSKQKEKGMQRYIIKNEIAFNNEAFHFHALIKNNTIRQNNIFANLSDVVKDIRGIESTENDIGHNYWGNYRGFDRDGDGIGDTPYMVLIFADKLWQFDHHLKFFYAAPVLSAIDFIERLAPFSEPVLLLEDPRPRREPVDDAGAKSGG